MYTFRKTEFLILSIIVLSVPSGMFAAVSAAAGNETPLKIGYLYTPESFDPIMTSMESEFGLILQVAEGLYGLQKGEDGNIRSKRY